MKNCEERERTLFQKLEVSVLVLISPGRVLHEFQKLAQAVALRRGQAFEVDANAARRSAAFDHPIQHKALDPDFSVGHPKANLYFRARLNRVCGFDQASTDARVRQIAPDRSGN